jgi:probable HAF family extracellular repeat protein
MNMKRLCLLPLGVFALTGFAQGTTYSLTDLSTILPSSYIYSVSGLNNNGDTVGATIDSSFTYRAYGIQGNVANALLPSASPYQQAFGINDSGVIVGVAEIPVGSSTNIRAVAFSGGATTDLGSLQSGGWSSALGVNNSGVIVGESEWSGGMRAFVYSSGSMVDLGTFGGQNSSAASVSNGGHTVGWAELSDGSRRAFLHSSSTMVNLGTLGGDSYARGVNSLGTVVGSSELPSGDLAAFAYSGGVLTNLGSIQTGGTSATSINDAGVIVGQSGSVAMIFENGVMSDLNSLLDPLFSSYILKEASRINNNGQILAFAQFNGNPADGRPVLLTPTTPVPEPMTLAAVGIGAMALRRRTKRNPQ